MAASAQEIQLRELKDLVAQLRTMISAQTTLIETLQKTLEEKTAHEKVLQEQIDYLLKKRFGASSEKRDIMPDQISYFDEAETLCEENPEKIEAIPVATHTRKAKSTHKEIFAGLPVEKVLIELPEEERTCEDCGTEMVLMGEEFVR